MSTIRRTVATLSAGALLATPVALATSAPAQATTKHFTCAGTPVEFSVEKDDGRYEVDVDIDRAPSASRWKIVVRHNGTVVHNRVHRADHEGDVDVDFKRPNTSGKDVFKVTVKKVGTKKSASRVITRA